MTKTKQILLRVSEDVYSQIKQKSITSNRSTNSLLTSIIVNNLQSKALDDEEEVSKDVRDKKSIRSTIRFTKAEAEILRKYAKESGWKLTEEIRYRILGTLNNSGNINDEELKVIRGIRASINALGTNVNTIIREGRIVDQEGKDICIKLAVKIKDAIVEIEQIVEKSRVEWTFVILKEWK